MSHIVKSNPIRLSDSVQKGKTSINSIINLINSSCAFGKQFKLIWALKKNYVAPFFLQPLTKHVIRLYSHFGGATLYMILCTTYFGQFKIEMSSSDCYFEVWYRFHCGLNRFTLTINFLILLIMNKGNTRYIRSSASCGKNKNDKYNSLNSMHAFSRWLRDSSCHMV